MKTIPTILAVLALSPAAIADDYTLFRVCQDQHLIRTSDGAEVGHVEYIVVEPASHRIISSIVTGGDVGDRFVAVPFESMTFGPDREIMLPEITRERIISAPVIERSQIATSMRIQSSLLDRTSEHFGVRFDANANGRERERREGGRFISTQDPNSRLRNRSESADKEQPAKDRENAQGRSNLNTPPAGRSTPESTQERNASQSNRPASAEKEQSTQGRRNAQERSSRDTEKPQGRSSPDTPPAGRSTPESTQERNASQSNRPASAEKEQSTQSRGSAQGRSSHDNTESGKGRAERDVPKPQERTTPNTEKVKPERSAEGAESSTEKAPSKTPRKPEKPEKESKRNSPPN